MISKDNFIKATESYNTFEKSVPAYYFRKSFVSDKVRDAKITIAVCGIYELFWGGERITRGLLSPYISNTDDYIYYDEYEVKLSEGENVIGAILGNGFQNNPGGHIWEFDKSPFRSAPMMSVSVEADGETVLMSDDSFKIHESPVRYDDYRFGEYYDANYKIDSWCNIGYDDSSWDMALMAKAPRGEIKIADIAPIVKEKEISPIGILKHGESYIYDFGESNAGVCRLKISGKPGQTVTMRFADSLDDSGDLNLAQIWFVREHWERDKKIVHKDTYVCRGDGVEIYEPTFTYHGFRYARVDGVSEEQATPELLTYLVYHTALDTMGDFSCSDKIATQLQEMTRRSIVSNFHHFPTDCPQREKNGWTADAALSAEAALINFNPERNYTEWMRNICRAQADNGSLPGIVPTGGWGFEWGNGPAWDSVLAWIPYLTYIYRGETKMISESADSFISYLKYIRSRCDERGLLHIGLGDWCPVGGVDPVAPLEVTDTVVSMDIANKIATMLSAIGKDSDAAYAKSEAEKYRSAIREHLIDYSDMKVCGSCQTSQAMGLYYGIFEADEEEAAFSNLLEFIRACDDHFDVGVLGGRVIFHVLSKFGYSDLAFHMITREDFPSYGNWIMRGATTLWETFYPEGAASMNHHFWGDISAWFVKSIAGIKLNPDKNNVNEVEISPSFIEALDYASAYHIAPAGEIVSTWRRDGDEVVLSLAIPSGMDATVILPCKYAFTDGSRKAKTVGGEYKIIKI